MPLREVAMSEERFGPNSSRNDKKLSSNWWICTQGGSLLRTAIHSLQMTHFQLSKMIRQSPRPPLGNQPKSIRGKWSICYAYFVRKIRNILYWHLLQWNFGSKPTLYGDIFLLKLYFHKMHMIYLEISPFHDADFVNLLRKSYWFYVKSVSIKNDAVKCWFRPEISLE